MDREYLDRRHDGDVYNTTELQEQFEVIGFMAPYVKVKQKSTGLIGTLLFQHKPRFYFQFVPE